MKTTEMREVLGRLGLRLTRGRGQNFLHDSRQLERIAGLAELGEEDQVLEIGAGLGPLTAVLARGVPRGRVLALDIEPKLVDWLREHFKSLPQVEFILADALRWLREEPRSWVGWKVVSNLPYSVASPVLVELAQSAEPPEQMVVTLQKEVVDRVVAKPDCRDYGVLTLLMQLRYEPKGSFRIGPECFWPRPDVDSGCVRLDRRVTPLLSGEREVQVFERLVKRAFSQRRKMIPKLLRQDWAPERLEAAMAKAGVDSKARAEHVSLEQYLAMTRELCV
ncbi:MAG: Ribosomal small subunit methyltransferase [Verrucomicrobiota bacterium]